MKKVFLVAGIVTFLLVGLFPKVNAQDDNSFDQHQTFDPTLFTGLESPYRSASGIPGPDYWQNKADYQITAKLDTVLNEIQETTTILYTNDSPDDLSFLWLELGQNLFKKGSRGSVAQGASTDAGGFQFSSVKIIDGASKKDADYLINDTRMQIRLDKPVASVGGKIQLEFTYSFKISEKQFRTARVGSKNGTMYDVAQWYPRMCVYDDIRGWNTLPYLGAGEFYSEYGDFDYTVTVPWDMIVAGSGKLINPEDVLTRKQISRLEKASQSDATKFIITPEEVGEASTRPVKKGQLTWHFKMKNSRDVVWAASKAYVWDAARANLPDDRSVLCMSLYPVESIGDSAWSRATEFLKFSVENFSERWFEYPYPVATSVGGPVGGMEYPGLIFCHWKADTPYVMFLLQSHEIGHNWFPMIVGSDERRNAFMDEGFNTFIDIFAHEDFNGGEFNPKRDGEYDKGGDNPARDIVPYMLRPDAERIVNYADVLKREFSHTVSYYKTALGLVLARDYILGADRFDYAFREYIRHWAYKHPAPEDFFRMMNNATGEDLNWFWNEWYYQTWTLDQGVSQVKYVDDNPSKGSVITLTNNRQMVMPVTLKIVQENGTISEEKLPVEIWQKGSPFVYKYPSTSAIDSVIVDPNKELPDVDPKNNFWVKREISGISVH